MTYKEMTKNELKENLDILYSKLKKFKDKNLKLDMSRGKPCTEQIELSAHMLELPSIYDLSKTKDGIDTRNYGLLTGINEAKKLFSDILSVPSENIIVGGNSSLSLMFDCISFSYQFGIFGNTPFNKLKKVKFLCPTPGYDRHFAICELFGIEMINIEMDENGPCMDKVKSLVENDESVKGIWCVPKYSNPTGTTYSKDTVLKFAALKPAAKDFRIYWDNAYIIHHLNDNHDELFNIFDACAEYQNEDLVLEFSSTSKMTFPGAGLACIASSKKNIDAFKNILFYRTIGPDKINQLRHCLFFNSIENLENHMKNHAKIIKPKFDIVIDYLKREITPLGIGEYTNPNGGYFISFNSLDGCAKRIYDLCLDAGLILTEPGATFPYHNDKDDKNIRIAPTFPPIEELKQAMEIFCTATKIASIEKLL